ncbi:hypothetical protein ACN38_g4086 [Penicillium nordicum]|uniref:Uncharacterized protein n=1 Tax=Penicillium nordicum TaxID=229535 RepID=A0A0N0RZ96_9EURO|nr:hypothetical protein ACN38_g4086 [Penicillium nordicum]
MKSYLIQLTELCLFNFDIVLVKYQAQYIGGWERQITWRPVLFFLSSLLSLSLSLSLSLRLFTPLISSPFPSRVTRLFRHSGPAFPCIFAPNLDSLPEFRYHRRILWLSGMHTTLAGNTSCWHFRRRSPYIHCTT